MGGLCEGRSKKLQRKKKSGQKRPTTEQWEKITKIAVQ